jgi:hypothetical protein
MAQVASTQPAQTLSHAIPIRVFGVVQSQFADGNKQLKMKTIRIRFTKKDVKQAGNYLDVDNCLLATALRRRHHRNVTVGGYGEATVDGQDYSPKEEFSDIVWNSKLGAYKPEVIGMKLTLLPHSQQADVYQRVSR